MNYLAHLYLAEDSEESIIGNFLGDFVKGKLTDQFSPEILKAIVTHRKVDAYTDSHERVKSCRNLISSGRRRYAGVIIDIFFDHFLSKNWKEYSEEEIDIFISRVYKVIENNKENVPQNVKGLIPKMIEDDWLGKYSDIRGLSTVFKGISKRIQRENPLPGAEEELEKNFNELENNFKIFFPQLIEYVGEVRR